MGPENTAYRGGVSANSKRLGLQDLLFIYGETPSSKMHVAGLLPFTPPPNATVDYLRDMIAEARRQEVMRPWNLKLAHPRLQFSPLHSWVEDKDFDFDYHVRRSALASPGDERELGVLVSRLHSNHLDLTRPPWELHVIEGLEGGKAARDAPQPGAAGRIGAADAVIDDLGA